MTYTTKLTTNRSRTRFCAAAITAVVLAIAAQASAQNADIVLEPADKQDVPATPTLQETVRALASDVDGLVANAQGAKAQYNVCVAAAIQDAGEPKATVQRRACDTLFAEAMIEHHQAVLQRFADAAVSFWGQVTLIDNQVAGLDVELDAVRSDKQQTGKAAQLLIEAYKKRIQTDGPPQSAAEADAFDKLAIQHQVATIRLKSLAEQETRLASARSALQAAKGQVGDLGYELKAVSRYQKIPIALAEARLVALRDATRSDWPGLGTGLEGLPTLLNKLGDLAYTPPEDGSDDSTLAQPAPLAIPDLALPQGDGVGYFERLLTTSETDGTGQ